MAASYLQAESLSSGAPYGIRSPSAARLRPTEIPGWRGERVQASEHYRRFLELWQHVDPELQPLVEQARKRLEGLRRRG